jgi:hypothetical protein
MVIWMEGHRAFFHNITTVSFTVDSFWCGVAVGNAAMWGCGDVRWDLTAASESDEGMWDGISRYKRGEELSTTTREDPLVRCSDYHYYYYLLSIYLVVFVLLVGRSSRQ